MKTLIIGLDYDTYVRNIKSIIVNSFQIIFYGYEFEYRFYFKGF